MLEVRNSVASYIKDFESRCFLLRSARLAESGLEIALQMIRDSNINVPESKPLAIATFIGAPEQLYSKILLRVQPRNLLSAVTLRIARDGSTPWEYVDVQVIGESEIKLSSVFKSRHTGFRLEILAADLMPGDIINIVLAPPDLEISQRFIKASFDEKSAGSWPRLLMIDSTPVGHTSATGQLKQTLLGDWPKGALLQIWESGGQSSILHTMEIGQSIDSSRSEPLDTRSVIEKCKAFQPEVIYFRPVDSTTLFDVAERVIAEIEKPLVIHMMDDWPERLRLTDTEKYLKLDAALRRLIARACVHLSISEAMSTAYRERYRSDWMHLANGVDLADFPAKDWSSRLPISQAAPFVIRYMGALADDMTYASVKEIAHAVSSLQNAFAVRLEIHTMDWCRPKAERELGVLPGVSVCGLVDAESYRRSLCNADALVIAYNFDHHSINYIGLSLANKMPECLASGVPLLAYGPARVATIAYLKKTGCAQVIDSHDESLLCSAIRALITQPDYCRQLGEKARAYVTMNLTKKMVQEKFYNAIVQASAFEQFKPQTMIGPFDRGVSAHYDETDCIAELYSNSMRGNLMIDVGAHHGWAFSPFLAKGWKIYAFEPDEKNRAKLLERLAGHKDKSLVSLDTRCVSNKSQKGVSFFSSEQSTGISGLSAFHESHVESQRVDTVTLTEFFEDKPLPAVDFLKIDTEGHDLFVLQGFPWERTKPAVIECEFEDTKTVPLGYTFHDLADFLVDKGYTVYVSEWHPIIRYGIRHDWNRLVRYPCVLANEKGWGNLLAFRDPIDEKNLVAAVHKVLKVKVSDRRDDAPPPEVSRPEVVNSTVASTQEDTEVLNKGVGTPANIASNISFAEWVKGKSLTLFSIGRVVKWALRFLKRHALISFWTSITLFALVVTPILISPLTSYAVYFWVAAGLLVFVVTAVIGAMFVRMKMHALRSDLMYAQAQLSANQAQLSGNQAQLSANQEQFSINQKQLSANQKLLLANQEQLSARQEQLSAKQ